MKSACIVFFLGVAAPSSGAFAETHGSAAAGAATFRINCAACHSTIPDRTLIGPSLFGVVGRRAGSLPSYRYSPAMAGSDMVWTTENINTFIASPSARVPGTKMTFAGLPDPDKRGDVIAFLKKLSAPD